jgi:hypothetical protein
MHAGTPRRWAIGALVVIGLALVAMPLAFDMFDRAPKGAQMIDAFRPFMTSARLTGYHAEMSTIDAAVKAAPKVADRLFPTPPGNAESRFAAAYPSFATFERNWRGIYPDMSGMIDTIQHNLGNYDAVAALPSFTLFPWFFVLPGVIILALIGLGLARPAWWRSLCWVLVALGVGLVLAPAVFQMFSRAPDGGRMMTAFKPIETRARVLRIQGYFSDIADGQGAVQLELIPALRRSGLDANEIATEYAGLSGFDADWIHILNDMTPLIGTMSDNVVNYEAVAALPPFALFPWFFVLPGLLVAGLALAAGPRRSRGANRAPSSGIAHPLTRGVT